jgi:hypothetical protein
MKTRALITMLAFVCAIAGASLGTFINGNVRLGWSYAAEPANSNLWFNLYATPELNWPPTNWVFVTNLSSLSIMDTNAPGGTNYHVDLNVTPGHLFFAATTTNFWGESSLTTNIVQTPPAPQLINTLKIQKLQ